MMKHVLHALVVIALLTSPVIAGHSDLQFAADASTAAFKADPVKAKDGENKLATDHHCCTSHTHYGAPAPDLAPAAAPAAGNERLPLHAEQFLAAFEPNPLLEPPARS